MTALIALIKPILLTFLTSNEVKKLVVELLNKYVKTTDNQIDDTIVAIVEEKLFKPQ